MRTSMPGWASWNAGKPRQQPFGRQRGQGRDGQHMVVVPAQQPVGGEPQIVERGADAGQIIPGLRRQRQRAVLPDEQADPEFLLQPPDLMADRGLRDVQLGRRTGEAQMPGGGLERPQAVQRRQPGGHVEDAQIHEFISSEAGTKCRLSKGRIGQIFACNRLALGDEHVHLFAPIDDKSSWFGVLGPGSAKRFTLWRRTLAEPAGTGAVDRARPARCRPVLERHHATKPKNRSGGLERIAAADRRRPLTGATGQRHLRISHGSVRHDHVCASTICGNIPMCCAARSGKSLKVRFVEPRDAEALQDYFRVALDPLPLQPLLRRHERVAAESARSFHPCRRGRSRSA